MQLSIDDGELLSITWQVLPYALLTFGEVLVSATGLEFAYSQAPAAMKGAIMAFWSLSVTVGNLWVLLVNAAVRNDAVTQSIERSGMGVVSFQMFFFAASPFSPRSRSLRMQAATRWPTTTARRHKKSRTNGQPAATWAFSGEW